MSASTSINGGVRKWKRYQDHKPVDLDWCPEIPSHWTVAPLKRFARFQSGDGITSLEIEPEGEYPVFGGNGLRGYTSKYTHDGDFVLLGRQGALCGNVNYASGKFWASEHAVVVTPSKPICLRWYGELLRAMNLGRYSMSAAQPGLSVQFVVNLAAPIPPLEEQRRIVAFLDRETDKIDALIAKKERLAELLQEKRTALISHAVTKGLDPTVPMKDSGIEWVGRIPAHWQTRRAKFLFRQTNLPVREGDGVVTAFRDGQVTLRENRRTEGYTFAILELGYQGIRKGQLVLHSMDAFAGAIGVSESDGKCSPEYIVCDPLGSGIIPDFYAPCLREMSRQGFIEVSCKAVRERAPRIRFSTFGEMVLPVPPGNEQFEIASHVKRNRHRYDEHLRKLRASIAVLAEYRTALISAAVTGKIDVSSEGVAVAEPTVSPETPAAKPVSPYFRRTVFAAEIIDRLCDEPTFGHVKFQKCLFVAQHHLRVGEFEESYKRMAAGPYDNRLVRSVDSQLEKQHWFKAESEGDRYAYRRLDKAGGHRKYFDRYFGEHAEQLGKLLDLFRPLDTDRAEIVATLYAVWNDFRLRGETCDDDRIVAEVLTNWHDRKKRFDEDRWRRALGWMREKGLVPTGFGKPTVPGDNGSG